jgi:hypothetical protein
MKGSLTEEVRKWSSDWWKICSSRFLLLRVCVRVPIQAYSIPFHRRTSGKVSIEIHGLEQ